MLHLHALLYQREFLSTPSARRATINVWKGTAERPNFYPRPPRGGRHQNVDNPAINSTISIHALREEGDLDFYYPVFANLGISIHALREEGDRHTSM